MVETSPGNNENSPAQHPFSEFTPDQMQGFDKWEVMMLENGRWSFHNPSFDRGKNEYYSFEINKRPIEPGKGGRIAVQYRTKELHVLYDLLDVNTYSAGLNYKGLPGEEFTAKFYGPEDSFIEMRPSGVLVVEKPTRVIMYHNRKDDSPEILVPNAEAAIPS